VTTIQYICPTGSQSNTVWFNFQTYVIFSINLVSLVTLRSSGTDILYGCHLLLDVCIIYFISCGCIMNSSLSFVLPSTVFEPTPLQHHSLSLTSSALDHMYIYIYIYIYLRNDILGFNLSELGMIP
jgi:hypothetical protein